MGGKLVKALRDANELWENIIGVVVSIGILLVLKVILSKIAIVNLKTTSRLAA